VIPDEVYDQVDTSIDFPALKANPEQFRGKVVALGGEVISAKALKDGTQLEVLELPLDPSDRPIFDLAASRGRFIVMHPGLDTAVVQTGRRITVVGEVAGAKTLPLDETEYTYPVINSRFLHLWSPRSSRAYGMYDPYPYGYYPYYYPYPYGFYYGYDHVIVVPDHQGGGGSGERRFRKP
jgi:outer membrane lipoprotein